MFKNGEIWAYPTDTSFGLGVRADDEAGLKKLAELKQRSGEKYFSLMVRDLSMLREFAEVPPKLAESVFYQTPKTLILKPKSKLPKSSFWPKDKVAFRVCTTPEIGPHIDYPITATSANISGKDPIFSTFKLEALFGTQIQICRFIEDLPKASPSEIWDLTNPKQPKQLR